MVSGFSSITQLSPGSGAHQQIGNDRPTGSVSKDAAGLGSSARISAIISVMSSASTPHFAISPRRSRRATGPDCPAAPASPDRVGSFRELSGQTLLQIDGEQPGRIEAQHEPAHRFHPFRSQRHRLRDRLGPAVSRPAGHSSAIRCAPIIRSTGSEKLSRNCSPRWSRRDGRSPAMSSTVRSSPENERLPPRPSYDPSEGPPSAGPPGS